MSRPEEIILAKATGAAACPAKIARVFSAAGVTITEGYGLTETSPVLTLNHYYDGSNKIGTVGVPLDVCDIIIDRSEGDYNDGEGEIIAAPMLALSLSFDHRMIDGALAQNALNYLKRLLSDPELLLMEA